MDDGPSRRTAPDVSWPMVLVGWLIGLAALVFMLLSVTGQGTGPGGVPPLRSVLWVWVLILVFATAWLLLLRGLPWPSPLRKRHPRRHPPTRSS